jgi:hypothetical protein
MRIAGLSMPTALLRGGALLFIGREPGDANRRHLVKLYAHGSRSGIKGIKDECVNSIVA